VSTARSPALIIQFDESLSPAARDRLVAVLAEHDLLAIEEDHLTDPRRWTAHFAATAARDSAHERLLALDELGSSQITAADIEDEDWARRTQADLPAVRVGRIVVAPPWDLPPVPAPAGDIVVEIEPSRGFGTGHHQSTRLCLALLQSRELKGRTVLDVGTGSGVLAIAAARLGAAFVNAIDVDPEAVESARENIARNGVSDVVEAHVGDLNDGRLPVSDVVTANLTGTLLARYASQLARAVRPRGSLIAAGFTTDEKPLVIEAFEDWFHVTESAEEDDWEGLVLTRI
jgi:ribosomal protein L11 methyltransferase